MTLSQTANATHNVNNMFDFVFPSFTYVDIVELNFTMTVDPDAIRKPGSGNETAQVILVPVCDQNQIDGYPASDDDLTICGEYIQIPVMTSAPGK